MSSLAELPELVGFFSYSREDDEDSHGALSALRDRIQRELRGQLGRTMRTFRLWQDKEAIAPGTLWESEIKTAVAQASFFIPIITPTVVRSEYCRFELEAFLSREAELGRSDLVFPILYIRVPELEDTARQRNDPVLSIIAKRQYLDWRELRHRDVNSPDIKEAIERFCAGVCDALRRPWLSAEERRAEDEAAAARRAEIALKGADAEARRRAEDEARREAAAAQARQREEDDRRRREALATQATANAAQPRGETATNNAGATAPAPFARFFAGKPPWLTPAIGAAVVVVGGAIVWLLLRSPSPPPVAQAPPTASAQPAAATPAATAAPSSSTPYGAPSAGQAALAKGKILFQQRCQVCHDIGPGVPNKVGPELNGLDGRRAGSVPGFYYSPAMSYLGIVWNEQAFAQYIADPKAALPGTSMVYAGLKDQQDIEALWAYIAQYKADGSTK
jgi:cytochrome c